MFFHIDDLVWHIANCSSRMREILARFEKSPQLVLRHQYFRTETTFNHSTFCRSFSMLQNISIVAIVFIYVIKSSDYNARQQSCYFQNRCAWAGLFENWQAVLRALVILFSLSRTAMETLSSIYAISTSRNQAMVTVCVCMFCMQFSNFLKLIIIPPPQRTHAFVNKGDALYKQNLL